MINKQKILPCLLTITVISGGISIFSNEEVKISNINKELERQQHITSKYETSNKNLNKKIDQMQQVINKDSTTISDLQNKLNSIGAPSDF